MSERSGGDVGDSFRMLYFNIFLFWAPLDVWAPNSISAPNFQSEGDHNKYIEIFRQMWPKILPEVLPPTGIMLTKYSHKTQTKTKKKKKKKVVIDISI